MKINCVNGYTPSNNPVNNKPSFEGHIILKGKNWNNYLADAFCDSYAIKHLAKGDKDIIARVKKTSAPKDDVNHMPGETIYKFNVAMKNPHPSFKEKLKSLFRMDRRDLNESYHSESSLAQRIEYADPEFLLKHRINKK